jgi:hypothetical protein
VAVQFPANAPGAVPTAAGIVFWQVSPDDYHLFAVSADGSYTLVRFVRGEWFPLIPWTAGAGVTADGAQALRVTTAGARITVAAGGRTLGTATAAGPGGGRVGMLVASFGLPGASASFDEFRVTPGP